MRATIALVKGWKVGALEAPIGAESERLPVVAPPIRLHVFLRDSPVLKTNDSCRNFMALF